MKKFLPKIVVISQLVAAAFGATGYAKDRIVESPSEITLHFSFSPPTFHQTGSGESVPIMDGLMNTIAPDLPSIPQRSFKIALPSGSKIRSINLESESSEQYRRTLAIATSSRPISWADRGLAPIRRNEHLPLLEADRPQLTISMQYLHGVPVALVNFLPVSYDEVNGIVKVTLSGRIHLQLEPDTTPFYSSHPLRENQFEEIRSLVDNPDFLSRSSLSQGESPTYDYLIVSGSSLIKYKGENDLSTFVANLESRGLRAKIVDTAEILATGVGKDNAAKIRSFIRNEYLTNGIQYALLLGDDDARGGSSTIPARKILGVIRAFDGSTWSDLKENIPADLYYGCLDGDFDGNGNGIFGEQIDGADGGDVDLLCEVTVGRVTAETPADLAAFVRKTLQIASSRVPRTTLLAGEMLFPKQGLNGSDYLKQLEGNVIEHGYETNGFNSGWQIDQLSDTKQSSWTGTDLLKALNSSKYLVVNHLGHSNESFNMRLYGSNVPSITNQLPFLLYSQGCLPSRFTANDAIHEKMIRSPYGPFAIIGNTTYGLAPEDPAPGETKTPGASQMLHRSFTDQLINHPEMSLGKSHQKSKERFLGYAATPEMRWVFWGANYFGDPSLVLRY